MAQADYDLAAHLSGLNQRTEINSIFQAILSNNSGSTAPAVTVAYMIWVDTSNATYYYLRMRNHANDGWVILGIYTVVTKVYTSYTEDTIKLTGNQSIDGIKTFTTSPVVPSPTTSGNIITMDNIIQKTAVGIGYGAGAGGTVTQATSKSTAVTLNKPTGQITMNNAALAAGATVGFVLNNSLVAYTDSVVINYEAPYAGNFPNYDIRAITGNNGQVVIFIKNTSASTLSEAIIFQYSIIKGVVA